MSLLGWLAIAGAWLIGIRILGMIAEGILYVIRGGDSRASNQDQD